MNLIFVIPVIVIIIISAFIVKILSVAASRSDTKAILVPSADQAGCLSSSPPPMLPSSFVRWLTPVPSAFINHISLSVSPGVNDPSRFDVNNIPRRVLPPPPPLLPPSSLAAASSLSGARQASIESTIKTAAILCDNAWALDSYDLS